MPFRISGWPGVLRRNGGHRPVALVLALALAGTACRPEDASRPPRVKTRAAAELDLGRPAIPVGTPSPALGMLRAELDRNLEVLVSDAVDEPAYFLSYDLVDYDELWVQAVHGAIVADHRDHGRAIDIDVRVGTPELDNSHGRDGDYSANGLGTGIAVAQDDDALAIGQALWLATETQYRQALEAFRDAESSESMLVRDDEPPHPDFSREEPLSHHEPRVELEMRALRRAWAPVLARVSGELSADEAVLDDTVVLQTRVENHASVNSEGSDVTMTRVQARVQLHASAQAPDGMSLERFASFDVHHPDQLPEEATLVARARQLRSELLDLREAPVAEPYTGPAILAGPAAGVFFHEIFGHRLEGHRQKDDLEGQTFSRMIDREVLPSFLDVIDDPTAATLAGEPLAGHYFVDDEAVRSQKTVLVERGDLRGFLLSRSPVLPFARSNGHGRRELGLQVVARQGNLIVSARKTMPESKLRAALIAEAKRQEKPYGLRFVDIQGGYTITDRSGPQAFKVLPLMVYRVWTDGRPDELVRGVDVVGTPLAAFETIVAAGDQPGIFNGMCGAESGWVPVSAVSPSLLLTKLEIERAAHDRQRPPLMPPPPSAWSGNDDDSAVEARQPGGGAR
jgi:predicted Zn-dependent protease